MFTETAFAPLFPRFVLNCVLTTRGTGTEQLARAQSTQEGARAGGDTGSGLVSQLTGGMETAGECGESRKQRTVKSTYCTSRFFWMLTRKQNQVVILSIKKKKTATIWGYYQIWPQPQRSVWWGAKAAGGALWLGGRPGVSHSSSFLPWTPTRRS